MEDKKKEIIEVEIRLQCAYRPKKRSDIVSVPKFKRRPSGLDYVDNAFELQKAEQVK